MAASRGVIPSIGLRQAWPTPRRPAAGHERVLDAVLQAIRTYGCDAVRFQDVAALAGTSISTLQYQFGSRDGMLVAGFRFGVERDLAYLDDLVGEDARPWPRLVTMIESCFGDTADLASSRVEWLELWRASVRDPELLGACKAVYAAWRERFTHVIEEGQRGGDFLLQQPLDSLITLLFAIIDGLTVPLLLGEPMNRSDIQGSTLLWLAGALGVPYETTRPSPAPTHVTW